MTRRAGLFVLIAMLIFLGTAEPQTSSNSVWSYDILKLKNGVIHQGLIREETPKSVKFQIVRRVPGRPTVWLTTVFAMSDVEKLERLTPDDRAALKSKLDEIDQSAQAEARRLEKLDLKPIEWGGKSNAGLQYNSDYFVLMADAQEEIVRRAAYRLEQVFAAYAQYFPPRYKAGPPTVIHIHLTLENYQKALPAGVSFKNPAFYDPTSNRVVCGTELQKIGEDLARFRLQASQSLLDLNTKEEEVRRLYGKKPELDRHLQPIRENREQVRKYIATNEKVFDKATEQLFRLLYHEAFHSYIACFVFPPSTKENGNLPGILPRWLNEGMAQVFETAIVEAGELRIGHADRERVEKAQDLLNKKSLIPIRELLTADPKVFVVANGAARPETDRAYVTSWALSSFLMFDRKIVGSTALADYVKAVNSGADIVMAFEKLTNQSLNDLEAGFHQWLKKLRPDGRSMESFPDR